MTGFVVALPFVWLAVLLILWGRRVMRRPEEWWPEYTPRVEEPDPWAPVL